MKRAIVFLGMLLLPAFGLRAQSGDGLRAQSGDAVAAVPFGIGEKAVYQVKLGAFGVGEGSMHVARLDTIRDRPAYHLKFDLKGGIPMARVDDRYQSWLDVSTLSSLRFDQNQKEVNYKRHRIVDMFGAEGRWVAKYPGRTKTETGKLASHLPLDDVSFMYFVRTMNLEPGKTYTFPRYWKEDGNPVTLQVLRRETITVPAGTFRTVVVRPIIKSDGLFSEGGKAELYFTDDDRRVLVMLRSDVPKFPGTLTLHLKSYTAGWPLRPLTSAPAAR